MQQKQWRVKIKDRLAVLQPLLPLLKNIQKTQIAQQIADPR